MGRKARQKLEQREKGAASKRPSRQRWGKRRWIVGLLLALLMVGGGGGVWMWNAARVTPEPAPRFNLLASNGRVISLDEFRGKQEVVLFFYMSAG